MDKDVFVITLNVQQPFLLVADFAPHTLSNFSFCSSNHSIKMLRGTKSSYFFQPLLFAVTQECPKQAAVQVVQDGYQEVFIKLKGCRKLKTKTALLLSLKDNVIL